MKRTKSLATKVCRQTYWATAKTLVARKSGFVFIDGDKLKEFGK